MAVVIERPRTDAVVDTGLEYVPADPVRIHVIHRERRVTVSDDGAAVQRAGHPRGWQVVAQRLAADFVVNVSRQGVISLPVVRVGPGEETIVRRVAEASLTLYQELLDLGG
jgi:hypothetical protein